MANIKLEDPLIPTFDLLGVKVAAATIPLACQFFEKCISDHEKVYVCVAPVSTIVDCRKNQEYRGIINKAALVTPDGMPVVWLGKMKGHKTMERTYGPDLLDAFCRVSEAKNYSHFFYGGTEESARFLVANLKKRFPRLSVDGSIAPGFLKTGEIENQGIIDSINHAKPDVLWVGLGSPKQDYWMSNHRALLNVPVIIGVGAAFDFVAGVKKQAPRWMQRAGLEWLFRLCSEPARLWKRYLIGNTQFIFYLLTGAIAGLFNGKNK